jgi:hypothetical protein
MLIVWTRIFAIEPSLDMLVALLREGRSHDLVGGTFLVAAQATGADRLLDRPEAGHVSNLKRPR